MHDYIRIPSSDLYFVADSHFRSGADPVERPRRDRLIRFLQQIPDGGAVFLLGDIFDFYFEYRSVIPKRYFDLFQAFYNCTKRGIPVHFIGGNHDYWVGTFLDEEVGVKLHPDDFLIEAQDRRICCSHGDYQIPGETGYKLLRAFMRNRVVINLAKILHPDLMDAIAARVSRGSKKRKRRTPEQIANHLADVAPQFFFDRGNDAFIMGHVHYPLHRRDNGRDFLILGDWITRFTYAHLHGGRFTLETFEGVTV
jgi:UDP-2,3-diacylglucosamine hydrolase